MTRPRYHVIPTGLLVNPAGLGPHFETKRSADQECRRLNREHPNAGYHVRPTDRARQGDHNG